MKYDNVLLSLTDVFLLIDIIMTLYAAAAAADDDDGDNDDGSLIRRDDIYIVRAVMFKVDYKGTVKKDRDVILYV